MALKKGEFIEVEYTGKLEDGTVFDTTSKDEAQEAGLRMGTNPMVFCLGSGRMLKGIEDQLEGKEIGKEYEIHVSPEDGFGKKSGKLIQLIATNKFRKENITPMPGMQVDVDGSVGIVKTVTGGRTIVDFNHPLAGKELIYVIKATRAVTDTKEQVQALVNGAGLNFKVKVEEKKVILSASEIPPEPLQKIVKDEILKHVKSISDIEFVNNKV